MPQSTVTTSRLGSSSASLRDGFPVQAVTLFKPAGDVVINRGAGEFQAAVEDAGCGDAIDVVVAVNGDPPAGLHGGDNPLRGVAASGKQVGIMQIHEPGLEELRGVIPAGNAAGGEHLGEQWRAVQVTTEPGHEGGVVEGKRPGSRHEGQVL